MLRRRVLVMLAGSVLLVTTCVQAQPPERGGSPDGGDRNQRGEPRGWRDGGRPQRPRFGPPLANALDSDGDGVISPHEIEQAAHSLRRLDRNGDGHLTRDEIRPERGPAEARGERRFRHDRWRSPGEFRGGRQFAGPPRMPPPGAPFGGPHRGGPSRGWNQDEFSRRWSWSRGPGRPGEEQAHRFERGWESGRPPQFGPWSRPRDVGWNEMRQAERPRRGGPPPFRRDGWSAADRGPGPDTRPAEFRRDERRGGEGPPRGDWNEPGRGEDRRFNPGPGRRPEEFDRRGPQGRDGGPEFRRERRPQGEGPPFQREAADREDRRGPPGGPQMERGPAMSREGEEARGRGDRRRRDDRQPERPDGARERRGGPGSPPGSEGRPSGQEPRQPDSRQSKQEDGFRHPELQSVESAVSTATGVSVDDLADDRPTAPALPG